MSALNDQLDALCEAMHDAYEMAAVKHGWQTQEASAVPWSSVPERNKLTMRDAVMALLARYEADRYPQSDGGS